MCILLVQCILTSFKTFPHQDFASMAPLYSWNAMINKCLPLIKELCLEINKRNLLMPCELLATLVTKLVETLFPKGPFWHFANSKREKWSFPFPIPSMLCCATVQATCRKQQTPQLWREGRKVDVDCFDLWSYKPYSKKVYQQFGHRL